MPARTLERLPRPTKAANIAFALVLLVRSLLGLWDPADEHRLPHGRGSDLIAAAERASDCSAEVVLMGSSRMRYGVHEEWLAEALDLPAAGILNVALDAADTWDLRRQAEMIASNECAPPLVVVDVAPWMFNANRDEQLSPRFFPLASLPDRLDVESSALRVRALWDWLAGDLRHKRPLTDWARALGETPPSVSLEARPLWRSAVMNRRRGQVEWSSLEMAERNFQSPEFSELSLRNLRTAVRRLRERGSRVVLLHTPTKVAYRNFLGRSRAGRRFESLYRSRVLSARETGADRIVRVDDIEELGLTESAFVDYGHLTPLGARELTARVAREIASVMAPKFPAATARREYDETSSP